MARACELVEIQTAGRIGYPAGDFCLGACDKKNK